MRKLQLDWHGYYPLDERTIRDKVDDRGGVFKISVEESGGHLKPLFVGGAESLRARLLKEATLRESCVRERAAGAACMFRFAYLYEKPDIDAALRALYERYRPACNDESAIPETEEAEVNAN